MIILDPGNVDKILVPSPDSSSVPRSQISGLVLSPALAGQAPDQLPDQVRVFLVEIFDFKTCAFIQYIAVSCLLLVLDNIRFENVGQDPQI